jgi:hypothetical protein
MASRPTLKVYLAIVPASAFPADQPPPASLKYGPDGTDVAVAIAKWHLRTDPNWHINVPKSDDDETSLDGVDPPSRWPEGANAAACNAFFGWLYDVRKRRMSGKAHLRTYSSPSHRRTMCIITARM